MTRTTLLVLIGIGLIVISLFLPLFWFGVFWIGGFVLLIVGLIVKVFK